MLCAAGVCCAAAAPPSAPMPCGRPTPSRFALAAFQVKVAPPELKGMMDRKLSGATSRVARVRLTHLAWPPLMAPTSCPRS